MSVSEYSGKPWRELAARAMGFETEKEIADVNASFDQRVRVARSLMDCGRTVSETRHSLSKMFNISYSQAATYTTVAQQQDADASAKDCLLQHLNYESSGVGWFCEVSDATPPTVQEAKSQETPPKHETWRTRDPLL